MFSLIATVYSHEKARYFGFVEVAIGFGMLAGPPVGSFFYG
jgi:MFS family permease